MLIDISDLYVPYDGWMFRAVLFISGLCVLTSKRSKEEWCLIAAGWTFGLVCWYFSGRIEILRLITWLAACKDINVRKVVKYTLYVCAAGTFFIILCSLFGAGRLYLAQDFGGTKGYTSTVVLGFGHPNSLQWMCFMLAAMTVYLYHDRMYWKGYGSLFAAIVSISIFTKSRTGTVCSIYLVLSAALLSGGISSGWKRRTAAILGVLTVTGSVAFSLLSAALSHFIGNGWKSLIRCSVEELSTYIGVRIRISVRCIPGSCFPSGGMMQCSIWAGCVCSAGMG